MSDYYHEIRFNSAEELLSMISPWSTALPLKNFIFRGHSNDEKYQLIPSALRPENNDQLLSQAKWNVREYSRKQLPNDEFQHTQVEFKILREFYRIADLRGLAVPQSENIRNRLSRTVDHLSPMEFLMGDTHWIPDSMLELTALAQHYGLMTRLLDWTYDPFVAAFFSANGHECGDTISIWCLNKEGIGMFDETATASNLKFVTPHYSGNPNLAAQLGVFTHWPIKIKSGIESPPGKQIVDRSPLDKLLLDYLEETPIKPNGPQLIKLCLSSTHVHKLRSLLLEHGYGHAKLFPGYSGVASEIKAFGELAQLS